ncbi:MAG: TetR/AcrR family transcriptional regulator [Spirochaetaceae bacterium]|nr:TetR/AcrR family transcriptional regulator [Spirochaetaceae bacterium]
MPRSKQFEPEQALSSAMSAFWRHGYDATSMEDLMDCMGIGRASIYNAFGNKRALFLSALEHYVSSGGALQGVRLPDSPRLAIVTAFRTIVERAVTGESCDGCLVVNTALELAPHDDEIAQIVNGIFVQQEALFRTYLVQAMACGEVPQTLDPSRTAQTLLALSIAVLVLARSRPDEPLLRSIEHQVQALLG